MPEVHMQSHLKNSWPRMLVIGVVAACAPSSPELQPGSQSGDPPRFNKVLVLYVGSDQRFRESMEDALVRQIPRSVAAHTVTPRVDLRNAEKAQTRMEKAGFDGVVLARIVHVGKKQPYEPGVITLIPTSESQLWRDWDHRWASARDPDDYNNDDVIRIATEVYAVANGRLASTNRGNAYDPGAVPTAAGEIAVAAIDRLKQTNVFATLTAEPAAGATAQASLLRSPSH
jgi:hypothetical protein